ncbi:MAG TPA: hypothetical protein VMR19_04735 [Candidatus Saccharimonadales bacterium]|nr:hypothetical protein [Candidatus Saccharimonadales bacterium]
MTDEKPEPFSVLIARAEQQHTIANHVDGITYVPKATGPIILGDGRGRDYMSPTEKAQCEAEARKSLFKG